MNNLQQLYDAYLTTKPHSGKVRAATSMMIHVCKALKFATQEEITSEYFSQIPHALDNYFKNYPLKATEDKAIIAEMIGRVGPNGKLKDLFDNLLSDKDENVKQFSLHSLEFFGRSNPAAVIPYVERFRKSYEPTMKAMAAHLTGHLSCSENYAMVLDKIEEWFNEGDIEFVQDAISRIIDEIKLGSNCNLSIEQLLDWSNDRFDNKIHLNI